MKSKFFWLVLALCIIAFIFSFVSRNTNDAENFKPLELNVGDLFSYVDYGANMYVLNYAMDDVNGDGNKDMIIATIPIGYADGIPKNLKNVVINDKIYKVVGSMCMDMVGVQVDENVNLYDKVTVLGGELLPVKQIANQCGTNSYTLFTGITNRVPRVYKEGENFTEINY